MLGSLATVGTTSKLGESMKSTSPLRNAAIATAASGMMTLDPVDLDHFSAGEAAGRLAARDVEGVFLVDKLRAGDADGALSLRLEARASSLSRSLVAGRSKPGSI